MAKTQAERSKEWREKRKKRKLLLEEKGLVEVRLIITKEQRTALEFVTTVLNKNIENYLFSITQPALIKVTEGYKNTQINYVQSLLELAGVTDDDITKLDNGSKDD